MALKIQDLIDIEQFQMLQDRLNEIYSFPSSIIDNDGNVLTATAWQDVCSKFHRQNSECEKECIKSDQYIASHLHEANPAVTYRCPHGLIDNATPIIIEGVHYGNYFTGQFFLEPPDLEFYRAQAKRYGFNEEKYLEAIKKVPIWTEEQLKSYLFFIKGLIEVIAGIGLKNLREIETGKRTQESEGRLRTILQTTMDGFLLVDGQGRLIEVNESYCRMSGYSARELLEMRICDLEASEKRDNSVAYIQTVMTKGVDRHESRHRRKDGSCFDVEVSVQYRPEEDGHLVAFLRDITERKRTEEALRTSEKAAQRLAAESELIAEIGRIIGSTLNIEDVYERFAEKVREAIPFDRITVNTVNIKEHTRTIEYVKGDRFWGEHLSEAMPLAGTRAESVVRTKASLLINSKSKENMINNFPRALSRRSETQSTMMIPLISKGEVFGILNFQSAQIDAYSENDLRLAERVGSQISGAIANAQLFRERRQAEKELRASNELFSLFMRHSPIYTFIKEVTPTRSLVLQASENYQQMIGIPGREMVGKTMMDLFPPEFAEKITADDWAVVSGGNVLRLDEELHGRSYTSIKFPIFREDKTLLAGYTIDITERKQTEEENRILQERLHRSEKMEALGTMAGGVAHDLNNVLGVLSGYSELLLEQIPEGSRARGHVEKILLSTEKGAAIIQDLLTLARRGVTVSDVINLNHIAAGFLKTPTFEKIKDYHPRVTFRIEMEEELLNIKGSSVHMEKTVMNLLSNAAEAISGSGEVVIRTENRYLDKPVSGYEEVKPGDYVVLTVSDTGIGIPAENREKIFEPFFTKKTMGRSGTGLGLAIVWGTVKDHYGYIDVQTEADKGTTFTLYFPVTREELIARQQKAPIERYMGQGESVLVVDDIAEQREVAAGLLRRLGYEVHAVASGEEAVAYLKENKADILVLDMIMAPGIDGLSTYRRVLEINPQQKAVLVSGFSETDRVRDAQRLGAGAYVKKPYVMEKIGIAIRNELLRESG